MARYRRNRRRRAYRRRRFGGRRTRGYKFGRGGIRF